MDVVMELKLPSLSELYRKICQEYSFKKIFIVSTTFNLGVYTWFLLFAFLLLLYRKQYRELFLGIPLFMYFLTIMLGPIVTIRFIIL